jgi:hypothetical protein
VLNWARRNYPRPKSQEPSPSLNALAIGGTEARQNRAQICEHTAA